MLRALKCMLLPPRHDALENTLTTQLERADHAGLARLPRRTIRPDYGCYIRARLGGVGAACVYHHVRECDGA